MKKTKIYLCDLTHTGVKIATDTFPLGVGFIASYAKKRFGDNVDIKIFKYPELLNAALNADPPDIIGFANYCWNDALNEFFCEKVKSISKSIITLKGGPSFPLKDLDRVEYWRERPFTDFYITK